MCHLLLRTVLLPISGAIYGSFLWILIFLVNYHNVFSTRFLNLAALKENVLHLNTNHHTIHKIKGHCMCCFYLRPSFLFIGFGIPSLQLHSKMTLPAFNVL